MNNILAGACLAASLILTACGTGKGTVIQPETAADREVTVIATAEAESRGETADVINLMYFLRIKFVHLKNRWVGVGNFDFTDLKLP